MVRDSGWDRPRAEGTTRVRAVCESGGDKTAARVRAESRGNDASKRLCRERL
jgi:hypothetical protein